MRRQAPIRFFAGFLLGSAALFAVHLALVELVLGVPTDGSDWTRQIREMKLALGARIVRPKLLVVGGSSVLFGISAREIESATGIPTLNLGLHAGTGMRYVLGLPRTIGKPGDAVLLALEYELYDSYAGDLASATDFESEYIVGSDPLSYRSLPLLPRLAVALRLPYSYYWYASNDRARQPALAPVPTSDDPFGENRDLEAYDLAAMNRHGDMTAHVAARRPPRAFVDRVCRELSRGISSGAPGFAMVREFVHWARGENIRVFATFPTISRQPGYAGPAAVAAFERLDAFYRSMGVALVESPAETLRPSREFFDTNYHLTREAALERTRRLVDRLERLL